MPKRIIFYYQTFSSLEDVLYDSTPITHIHLSAIHFGLNYDKNQYIHLNNLSPYDTKFDNVWKDMKKADNLGIKVILMLGGAGSAYTKLFSNFKVYYNLLYELIKNKPYISGIDLDIEEKCSLNNIKFLIRQIVTDFGKDFIITTSSIQESLETDTPGISGFIYKDLINSDEGKYIDYINGQFYIDYTLQAYDDVIENGYKSEKIVMGMIGNENTNDLSSIVKKYDSNFGGVFIWEYCLAEPSPIEWLKNIDNIINMHDIVKIEQSDIKSHIENIETNNNIINSLCTII